MKGAADINPGFRFDVGDASEPAQAPWDFGGAHTALLEFGMSAGLRMHGTWRCMRPSEWRIVAPERCGAPPSYAPPRIGALLYARCVAGALAQADAPDPLVTSIDEKIQRQRRGNLAMEARRRSWAPQTAASSGSEEEAAGDEEDEAELAGDSDSDGPSGSDSEDLPLPGEEDDSDGSELEGGSDADSDGGAAPAAAPPADSRKRQRPGSRAAAQEEAADIEEEEQEEEEGSDEEQQAGGDWRRQQQQQQARQGRVKKAKGADGKAFFDPTPEGTKFAAKVRCHLACLPVLVAVCRMGPPGGRPTVVAGVVAQPLAPRRGRRSVDWHAPCEV